MGKEVLYQPARDVETLTVKRIVDALDNRGNSDVPVATSQELEKLRDALATLGKIAEQAAENTTLKRI